MDYFHIFHTHCIHASYSRDILLGKHRIPHSMASTHFPTIVCHNKVPDILTLYWRESFILTFFYFLRTFTVCRESQCSFIQFDDNLVNKPWTQFNWQLSLQRCSHFRWVLYQYVGFWRTSTNTSGRNQREKEIQQSVVVIWQQQKLSCHPFVGTESSIFCFFCIRTFCIISWFDLIGSISTILSIPSIYLHFTGKFRIFLIQNKKKRINWSFWMQTGSFFKKF